MTRTLNFVKLNLVRLRPKMFKHKGYGGFGGFGMGKHKGFKGFNHKGGFFGKGPKFGKFGKFKGGSYFSSLLKELNFNGSFF